MTIKKIKRAQSERKEKKKKKKINDAVKLERNSSRSHTHNSNITKR